MKNNLRSRMAAALACLLISTFFHACTADRPVSKVESRLETTQKVVGEEDYKQVIQLAQSKVTGHKPSDMDLPFIKWVEESHKGFAQNFLAAVSTSGYSDAMWWQLTGKTLHVLLDTHSGILNSEETAKSHNVHLKQAKDSSNFTLTFAGDLCLSEKWHTLKKFDAQEGDITQCVSSDLLGEMNEADIMMLNNEFTYSLRGSALPNKLYTFRANPDRISILQAMGVDIVSLANNHCYDFGKDAFFDTIQTLVSAKIPYVGAGKNKAEAEAPVYYIIGGMKIAFVAATRAEKYIMTPEAGEDSPGVLRTYKSERFIETIRKAKDNSDYVIAYVHWGTESSNKVVSYQKEMGREYIDAGADAVIGGHPHVLQGMEYYKGKPIVYSLGDFWFNYVTKDTGMIELSIENGDLKQMTFIPCIQKNCFTSLETDAQETRRIFDYMESISFGIQIDDDGVVSDK